MQDRTGVWNGPAPVGSTGRTQVVTSTMAAVKLFVAEFLLCACIQYIYMTQVQQCSFLQQTEV